ncbi:MAG: Ig-like domain repeat protein [Thaumarchaeota archaeon]|nr:Ig-like domain repeat protein [Nitrososphaerota archaeon]
MKKILALLLIVLVLISSPIALSIQVPRQVDPSSAPADPVYGQGLYLFYGSIAALLASGNFSAARQLINHTGFIHIPPEISDAFNSFNKLVSSTSSQFTTIDHQLKNASNYLATGRLQLAKENVTEAVLNLRSANSTLTQLFGSAPQLAALTGIPSSLFLQKLQPLETIYTGYVAEANHLTELITGATKLDQTFLAFVAGPSTIETGSNVTVSGHLSSSSGPLVSRNVTVYFGNQAIGQALTTSSGNYSAELSTPYFYGGTASLFASFLPVGNDTLVYAPATSVHARLNVTFSAPTLAASVTKITYAGQPLLVKGSLAFGGHPLSGFRVSVSGFNLAATGTTLGNGSFSLGFAVPSGVDQGAYPLTLQTSGNRTIGPLTSTLRVFVIKEDPAVTSSVPAIAFAGFPTTVSGSARANGTGLVGARVLNVGPGPSVNATTSNDGTFSFTVTPALTTPNGEWSYTVELYPAQSWISPTQVKVSVLVINPLVLVFPASSLGLLAFVIRRRRPPVQASVLAPAVEATPPEAVLASPPPVGLAGVYSRAVELVARATSVPLQPQMTIREYLGAVRGKLKRIESFEYISSALESQLYGPGIHPEAEKQAEAELDALRGELEA